MQSTEEQEQPNVRKPISFISTKRIPKRVKIDFSHAPRATPKHLTCDFCGEEARWSLIALPSAGSPVDANYCHKCLIEKALTLRKALKEKP